MVRADNLTVVFDDDRELTFTAVHYDLTWDRLFITIPDGGDLEYDRWNIVDIQASTTHTPIPVAT